MAAARRRSALVTLLAMWLLLFFTTPPCSCSEQAMLIPRLIHRSFMSGEAALRAEAATPGSGFREDWLGSCLVRLLHAALHVSCNSVRAITPINFRYWEIWGIAFSNDCMKGRRLHAVACAEHRRLASSTPCCHLYCC